MKRIIYFIATLTLPLAFPACTDWLDASSDTQIKGDDLFESEEGFQDALTGIYLNMASESLYGKNLTWYFTEIMVQPYLDRGNTQDAYKIMDLDGYKNVLSEFYIKSIWNNAYTTIANINNALKMIDEKGDVLSDRTRSIYEGELLALRAYIHLDLMRLFGYGHYNDRADFENRLTIPYVTVYSKDLTPQRTYAETMKLVVADLEKAVSCLENDPLVKPFSATEETSLNEKGYWNNRKLHLNYYAAKALLARAYMWDGSTESIAQAVAIATELTKEGSKVYSWTTYKSTDTDVDLTFTSEHLFTLNVYNFKDSINDFLTDLTYNNAGYTLVIPWSFVAYDIFNAYSYDYDQYEYVPGYVGYDDIRFEAHFKETSLSGEKYMYSNKLYQTNGYSKIDYRNLIPMIKITEMYYILAENYLNQNKDNEALDVINHIREKRELQTPLTRTMIEEEWYQTVSTELLKEYMREFISEGQLVYYLKRKGLTSYSEAGLNVSDRTFSDETYVLPLPTDEITIGNRVQ